MDSKITVANLTRDLANMVGALSVELSMTKSMLEREKNRGVDDTKCYPASLFECMSQGCKSLAHSRRRVIELERELRDLNAVVGTPDAVDRLTKRVKELEAVLDAHDIACPSGGPLIHIAPSARKVEAEAEAEKKNKILQATVTRLGDDLRATRDVARRGEERIRTLLDDCAERMKGKGGLKTRIKYLEAALHEWGVDEPEGGWEKAGVLKKATRKKKAAKKKAKKK